MNDNVVLTKFDSWLEDTSEVAALVMRQWLVPVEGRDAIFFPPTYAAPEDSGVKRGWLGYNLDRLEDGTTICLIDSVGSQANRMEPLFKRKPYSSLVPQVAIKVKEEQINLLDVGHRAADALVRYSDKQSELEQAFGAAGKGNFQRLAKIAPTSIVFGCWDSRETGIKIQRVVRSVIRAFNVDTVHRSAQYKPPVSYTNIGALDEPQNDEQKNRMSEEGFLDNPSSWQHGGVRLRQNGEIRRDAALNLAAIRALGADTEDNALKVRRYILGLALVAFTAPQDFNLREGCQLVPDPDHPAQWEIVCHNGTRQPLLLDHKEALEYAEAAAKDFKVGDNLTAEFKSDLAKEELGKSKSERKKGRRSRSRASSTRQEGSDQQEDSEQ